MTFSQIAYLKMHTHTHTNVFHPHTFLQTLYLIHSTICIPSLQAVGLTLATNRTAMTTVAWLLPRHHRSRMAPTDSAAAAPTCATSTSPRTGCPALPAPPVSLTITKQSASSSLGHIWNLHVCVWESTPVLDFCDRVELVLQDPVSSVLHKSCWSLKHSRLSMFYVKSSDYSV